MRSALGSLQADMLDYEKDAEEYEKDAENYKKDVKNCENEIEIYKERANLHTVAVSKSAAKAQDLESTIESQRKEVEKLFDDLRITQNRCSELELLLRQSNIEVNDLKESVSFLKLKNRGLSSEKEAYERKSNRLEGEVAIANNLLKVARRKAEMGWCPEGGLPGGAVSLLFLLFLFVAS